MNRIAPFALLALSACGPQSAELLDASVTGWLSEETSFVLYQGLVDMAHEDWDASWNIDCRTLEDGDEALRLDGGLNVCENGGTFGVVSEGSETGETWLNDAAWRGFNLELDNAWRGEGIYTHEGDLQVAFHHRLPGGQDFRFLFVIDPDFSPTECVVNDAGETVAAPYDGTPWRDAWNDIWTQLGNQSDVAPFMAQATSDFPNGDLYFLNARSYQIDGENITNANLRRWTLPEEWMSGFAHGTFGVEDMHSRPNFYARPYVYQAVDADDFFAIVRSAEYVWYRPESALPGDAEDHVTYARQDLNRATPAGLNVGFQPILVDNSWRDVDGEKAGLDNWDELAYSWVVLSEDSDPTPGGKVSGAFSILMDPDDSSSRFVVQGRCEIPSVRRERFGGPDLRAETAEAAGFSPCITGSPTDYTTDRP